MSTKTVYLISGANRGIGLGLATTIAKRPNTIVFAGARDPSAQALKDLSAKYPNVYAVKLNSGNKEDNEAAAKYIQEKAGQLDVIIANAGIAKYYGPLATTPISEFEDHWKVNAMGPVVLFQATHKLLLASPTKAPIFVVISTGAASISAYIPMSSSAYGSSKTAVNFLVKVLDDEHAKDGLIAFSISPGWVATDMGNKGANSLGMAQAPVSLDDSITGILSRIDGATREKSSGKFWNFKATRGNPWDIDSDEVPW